MVKVVKGWNWFNAVTIISYNVPSAISFSLVSMVAFSFCWTQNDALAGKFVI